MSAQRKIGDAAASSGLTVMTDEERSFVEYCAQGYAQYEAVRLSGVLPALREMEWPSPEALKLAKSKAQRLMRRKDISVAYYERRKQLDVTRGINPKTMMNVMFAKLGEIADGRAETEKAAVNAKGEVIRYMVKPDFDEQIRAIKAMVDVIKVMDTSNRRITRDHKREIEEARRITDSYSYSRKISVGKRPVDASFTDSTDEAEDADGAEDSGDGSES